MVLRQPMYRALREAGHELVLIVRPSVKPLLDYIAPGAATILLPTEVYRDDLQEHWNLLDDVFRAARDFRPEVLLVAPYQWTQFEERLSDELKDVPGGIRRVGMSGRLYAGDPYLGRAPASRLTFDVTVEVGEDLPEIEKNAALTAAVLEQPVDSAQVVPRIEPGEATLEESRQILGQIGLTPGEYWIACVTGTVNVPIKAWQLEKWAQLLSHCVSQHNRRFLFIGLPVERQVVDEVRRLMGDAADRTRVWMNENAAILELVGLTALSAGYAGHDTGPMHVAAALGKPVLAVFGGGHKLRFAPRCAGGAPSVVVTVGVPCSGCAWTCPFEISHCVKDVPVERVIDAADELEAGRIAGFEPRVLSPDDALRDRMIREAAAFARKQLRESGERGRQLHETWERTIPPLQAALNHHSQQSDALAGKLAESNETLQRLAAQSADLDRQLTSKKEEAEHLSADLALRTREAEELRRSVAARDQAAERLRNQVLQLERAAPQPPDGAGERATLFSLSPAMWWQFANELLAGRRNYVPRRPEGPLPKIMLVTPIPSCLACDCPDCDKRTDRAAGGSRVSSIHACRSADVAAVRQTIESVLAQQYPRLNYVIATVGATADGAALSWLEPYASRLTLTESASARPYDAIARAFDSSDADVLGWLEPGDSLEPGALQNVGEYFRDRPRSAGAVFDDTLEFGQWRLAGRRPRLDVYSLLNESRSGTLGRASVFVRRRAYRAIGRFHEAAARATGWDFLLRFSRRHGFDRPGTHVTCRRPQWPESKLQPLHLWQSRERSTADALAAWSEDLTAARAIFESSFSRAGRLRAGLIHQVVKFGDSVRRLLGRDRLVFPFACTTSHDATDSPADAAEIPTASDEIARTSPMTGRQPVRLIFSAATNAGPCAIYHDPGADLAFTIDGSTHARVEQPSPWPFVEHRPSHVWERRLIDFPCPRARVSSTSDPRNQSQRLLSVLSRLALHNDRYVSFLHAACGDGKLLWQLRTNRRWTLTGTEGNPQSAAAARAEGGEILEADFFDAPSLFPTGRAFDVIFLDERAPRGGDLLTALRRLRQLMKPDGCIVLAGANLNSRLLDLFGPTWPGWQVNRQLTLPGRRGVARLACMADLRMVRYRTFTDTAACAISFQQHRLRLAGSSPTESPEPADRRKGYRLTAWANLLWDWRGKGDAFYAVLRN